MPNVNYRRGACKEWYIKKKFEKEGKLVIRSAGSHSFSDLIVIDRINHKISFIQVKPKKFSKPAKARLESEFAWLNDEFIVDFYVYSNQRKKKVEGAVDA